MVESELFALFGRATLSSLGTSLQYNQFLIQLESNSIADAGEFFYLELSRLIFSSLRKFNDHTLFILSLMLDKTSEKRKIDGEILL